MNIYNENFQDRVSQITQTFVAQGYFLDDAQQLAYRMVDLSLFKQQALVSYDNIFWLVALATVFCIPIILLIRNNKKADSPKVDVHLE